MEHPSDEDLTQEIPVSYGYVELEDPPQHGIKRALGFDGDKPEDRWLWFAIRLSLVLFMYGVMGVVIAAFAKIMLAL